jgi:dihydroorotate dehydrogenase
VALLDAGKWQARTEPFLLSFMSVAATREERQSEIAEFGKLLGERLSGFAGPVGLQINFSCPNVGLDPRELVGEMTAALDALGPLGIPLVPKFNVLLAPEVAVRIAEHPHCAAICVSNTIPYGKEPDRINWRRLFGGRRYWTHQGAVTPSPLAEFGGGGLSGAPLFPLVCEWLYQAKKLRISKPLNVGGGILHPRDVDLLVELGLDLRYDSIFVGSVAIVRPWRVKSIVRRAHQLVK